MDRSSDAQPSLSLFSHDFPECQMELAVTVVSPNTCQMTFTLTDPETGQRLPGAWVRLFDRRSQPGAMEAPEITSLPAKNGVVQLIDRPLGHYLIEITQQDRLLGEITLDLLVEGEP
jgi:hypothetical protein